MNDIETIQTKVDYTERILSEIDNCLTATDLTKGEKYQGKVRDRYDLGDELLLVTTDRQSAFDRVLASIPFKGQVLNLTGAWWFEHTKDIVANHVLEIPDPNVTAAKKCEVFPIEFVVRGFITGSSATSLWTVYNKGDREYCGLSFPDGLKKNQRLDAPVLTPTTKEEAHDRPISPRAIVEEGWMSQEDWDAASQVALELFKRGQETADKHGLILVDTKYEMGKDSNGTLTLVDEIHTPDSSRYWISETFEERFAASQEPQNVDKEFLRLWFKDNCDPYGDEVLPAAPRELVVELSRRYLYLYEKITGESFPFPASEEPVQERMQKNLSSYL